MKTLDISRPGIASLGVGLAQGALDEAVSLRQAAGPVRQADHLLPGGAAHAGRHGHPLEAARALVYAAARHIDAHPKDMSKVSSMCKVFATDMAMKVTTDAVQVLGGYGYMSEYPVEKMMRDAKILQIYEGTNQIQRNVIGQELNKEYVLHRRPSRAWKIIVCVKQVPDAKDVRLDPETNTLAREGVESIMNPYDQHALEEAVRLKEEHGRRR